MYLIFIINNKIQLIMNDSDQLNLADQFSHPELRKTHTANFLAKIDSVIDWKPLVQIVATLDKFEVGTFGSWKKMSTNPFCRSSWLSTSLLNRLPNCPSLAQNGSNCIFISSRRTCCRPDTIRRYGSRTDSPNKRRFMTSPCVAIGSFCCYNAVDGATSPIRAA